MPSDLSSVQLYQRLQKAASQLDEEEFAVRYAGWYILSQDVADGGDRLPFATQIYSTSSRKPVPTPSFMPASVEGGEVKERLWKVEKSSESAWKRRISVGRAPNNDIVIRHHSVSKLHAHFHAVTGVIEPGRAPSYLLTDVGSKNGTRINGEPLAPDTPTPVSNRALVVFGTVAGQYLDAATLHARLASLDWF